METEKEDYNETDSGTLPVFYKDGEGEWQLVQVMDMLAECEMILIDIKKRYTISGIDGVDIRGMAFGLKYALDSGFAIVERKRE